jgi:hypothetical protein
VLWVGIVLFVLMGLYPPWVWATEVQGVDVWMLPKYRFLLNRPLLNDQGAPCYSIDRTQLVIQWLILVAITGGLFITFRTKPNL